MIVRENYKTRADGVALIRTYSDAGYRIIRNDGVVYDEAIDVENSAFTYVESDELIDVGVADDDDIIIEDDEYDGEEEISAEDALAELLEVLEE